MTTLFKVEMDDEKSTIYRITYSKMNLSIKKEWDAVNKNTGEEYRQDEDAGYYGTSLDICAQRFSTLVGFEKATDVRNAAEEIGRISDDLKIEMKKLYTVKKCRP